jgi:putative ABC transport system permease protein
MCATGFCAIVHKVNEIVNGSTMFRRIILRLGLRYISRRWLQSVLFILGVALGVAVVIAIDLANNSASRAFALSAESISGKATHQILGTTTGIPSTVYTRIRLEAGS